MKVPKTAHQMELDGRKAQKEVKVKFDIESAVQEVITDRKSVV